LISKKDEDKEVKDFFVNYRPVLGAFRELIQNNLKTDEQKRNKL